MQHTDGMTTIRIGLAILLLVGGIAPRGAFGDPRPTDPNAGPNTVELLTYQAAGYKFRLINQGAPTAPLPPEFTDFAQLEFRETPATAFQTGRAAFGTGSGGACPLQQTVHTHWPTNSQLLVRRLISIPAGVTNVRVMVSVDNDIVGVFFNGTRISPSALIPHEDCPILDEFRFDVPSDMVRAGLNLVAFHVQDRGVESFFDARILAESPIPGGIVVVDAFAGMHGLGALFLVDPVFGARRLLSDFGKGQEGPEGQPHHIAVEAFNRILAVGGTDGRGVLFRVDLSRPPGTRHREKLSDFSDPQQGDLGVGDPEGVAVEESGHILVVDAPFAMPEKKGALFRVDPSRPPGTRHREKLSDFGDMSQGKLGDRPVGVAVDVLGDILVPVIGAGLRNALFRINPLTGDRDIFSNLREVPEPETVVPSGVAVEASGDILVVDATAGMDFKGALFRVNPSTGRLSLVSDFGKEQEGKLGEGLMAVAVEASGDILVVGFTIGTPATGALFRVDPSTGHREVLSDFGNVRQGAPGVSPSGVAVLPTLTPITVNSLVRFPPPPTFDLTPDITGCPAGFVQRLLFETDLTNTTSHNALSNLVVQVITLTQGNVLENAHQGPGGVGARLLVPNVDEFGDGVLSPGEMVRIPFRLCLKEIKPFQFFVDVLGVVR